jgi:hypothetical protein
MENAINERIYTSEELAGFWKLHPTTIRKLFVDEPGVIRLGRGSWHGKRQHYRLRIPQSVADRVFGRMKVGRSA